MRNRDMATIAPWRGVMLRRYVAMRPESLVVTRHRSCRPDLAIDGLSRSGQMFKKILIANRGRNRLPRHPHRAGGWGSRRSRSIPTPTPARRMSAWPTRASGSARAGGGVLSQGRADHRRLQGDRGRGGSSGLWLPVRADQLRQGAGEGRDRLHRPAAQGDRRDGRQDRIQEAGQEGGGQRRPRLPRRHRDDRRSGEDREGHRLSGDDEGLGRRRRQGHAARL